MPTTHDKLINWWLTDVITSWRNRNGGLLNNLSVSGGFLMIFPNMSWVFFEIFGSIFAHCKIVFKKRIYSILQLQKSFYFLKTWWMIRSVCSFNARNLLPEFLFLFVEINFRHVAAIGYRADGHLQVQIHKWARHSLCKSQISNTYDKTHLFTKLLFYQRSDFPYTILYYSRAFVTICGENINFNFNFCIIYASSCLDSRG